MSYYERHIFFCLNQRDKGEDSCAATRRRRASTTASRASRPRSWHGPGGIRVNKAGCLDRCAGGPVAVVYPEGVWYTFVDDDDIDEIVDSHLKQRSRRRAPAAARRRRPMNVRNDACAV